MSDETKMLFEALRDAHRLRRKLRRAKASYETQLNVAFQSANVKTERLNEIHRKIRHALDETSFATMDNAEAALDRLISNYNAALNALIDKCKEKPK